MYVKCVNAGETFDFSNVKQRFIDDEHKDQYPWYDILSNFKDNYYELEGKSIWNRLTIGTIWIRFRVFYFYFIYIIIWVYFSFLMFDCTYIYIEGL